MSWMPSACARTALVAALIPSILACNGAQAQEPTYALTIHADRFEPSALNVKAGVKFKLVVRNATPRAAEFESAELNREKVVAAGTSGTIYIGPLQPGRYPFFDDFHQSTKGVMVAK